MEQSLLPNLLIRLFGREFSADIVATLAKLSLPDWDRLITWTAKQQVSTLFYTRLRNQGAEHVIPAPLCRRLQSFYQADVNRNARLGQILGESLLALQRAHIPTIVLHDAYLAETVYTNFALRRINELELLIAPPHIPAAVETILALGFYPFGPLRTTKSNALVSPLPRFMKAGVPASLSIQQTLTPAKALAETVDMAAVWQRAMPLHLLGVQTYTLADADQLLSLAEQTIQHQLWVKGFYALCDLNLFLRQRQTHIHWVQVPEQARLWQWDKQVHLALYLTNALLGTPIPEPYLHALQPPDFSEELAQQAISQLLALTWQSSEPPTTVPTWGYHRLLEQGHKLLQYLRLARSTPSHV